MLVDSQLCINYEHIIQCDKDYNTNMLSRPRLELEAVSSEYRNQSNTRNANVNITIINLNNISGIIGNRYRLVLTVAKLGW